MSPKEYAADTHAAWYALCEVNGLYETNGDHEVLIAPGIMYEARTWTAEISVQLPLWNDIEERAELDYAIVTGIRFSW